MRMLKGTASILTINNLCHPTKHLCWAQQVPSICAPVMNRIALVQCTYETCIKQQHNNKTAVIAAFHHFGTLITTQEQTSFSSLTKSTTVPTVPFTNPVSVHKFCVSMIMAPTHNSMHGSKPPANFFDVSAARLQELIAGNTTIPRPVILLIVLRALSLNSSTMALVGKKWVAVAVAVVQRVSPRITALKPSMIADCQMPSPVVAQNIL
jgi:hypothetical protein